MCAPPSTLPPSTNEETIARRVGTVFGDVGALSNLIQHSIENDLSND
jgi:hypothetical protein